MNRIAPPQRPREHGDRPLDCEYALDMPLRQLVDDAISAGWEPAEVFAALMSLLNHQATAYGEDPDPADDPNWVTGTTQRL